MKLKEKEIEYLEKRLIQMKWKYLLVVTAFAGAFGFGTMITQLGDPSTTSYAVEPNNGTVAVEKTNYDEFVCPMFGNEQGRSAKMRMEQHFAGSMLTVLSEELGMNVNEIQTARHEGKSIAQLAEEKNVSVEKLKAAMVEGRKANLEQLVANGDITQDQMDIMMENMNEMIETAIHRENVGPMNGRGGKMGQHMGRQMEYRSW